MIKGSEMNFFNLSIILLVSIFFFNSPATASESYDLPISYNKRYVKNPENVIIKSLLDRGWEVKEKHPGKIIGWLNNYKGNEIILDISFDDSKISFKHISSRRFCGKNNCKIKPKHYNMWRLYLRKSIALNIHTLAINELLKIASIKEQWLNVLKSGNIKEKIKFARNIIDIGLFNSDALDIIEAEVRQGYMKADMTGNQVQQYAFYCKVLARTQKAKYLSLLQDVEKNAASRKLKKYLTNYIKNNYPAANKG